MLKKLLVGKLVVVNIVKIIRRYTYQTKYARKTLITQLKCFWCCSNIIWSDFFPRLKPSPYSQTDRAFCVFFFRRRYIALVRAAPPHRHSISARRRRNIPSFTTFLRSLLRHFKWCGLGVGAIYALRTWRLHTITTQTDPTKHTIGLI